MQISDTEPKFTPDPNKVFKVIADIIADREGIKVAVKSIKRRDEQKTA
jgi:hypothetical protein